MNLGEVVLTAAYTSGAGVLTVSDLSRVLPGLVIPPTSVTVYQKSTFGTGGQVSTTYQCTAASGTSITLGAVLAGSDQNYAAGDLVLFVYASPPVVFPWDLATGTPATVANDVGRWWTVTQPLGLTGGYISAKTGPVGASLAYNILYKRGVAAFTPIGTGPPTYEPTVQDGANTGTFTLAAPFAAQVGDILRIDCLSIGSTTPGQDVNVLLLGTPPS